MSKEFIISTFENGVRKILLNRPEVRNAINYKMFMNIAQILNEDASNDDVAITIFTGTGDYFSSGNDFNVKEYNTIYERVLSNDAEHFISAFINYPKLLVAVVNGPAFGIAVTFLPLFDVVYCSNRAIFSVPYGRLGILTACSSYTFPRILGRSKSSEILLLGKPMEAQEALQLGFVSKIVKHEEVHDFIETLYVYGQLSVASIISTKKLVTASEKYKLLEAMNRECAKIKELAQDPEAVKAILNYFINRSKL